MDLEVYINQDCTQKLTFIDWGIIHPGDNVSYIAYIRNIGTVNFVILCDITYTKMPAN